MLLLAPFFMEDYFTMILLSAPPPPSTPFRCLSLCSVSIALQLATSKPTLTPAPPALLLSEALLILLKPLSLPPSCPCHHGLVLAVPATYSSFISPAVEQLPIWDLCSERSSEAERLWRTLSYPTWRHGIAFPA